jgi:hypothetical protein
VSTGSRVAEELWLGLARCAPIGPVTPSQRRALDQRAADAAERQAVAASGRCRDQCAISRSHTGGRGAAVVAPIGVQVGVDLVLIDRVTDRHSAAIVSQAEWAALAPYAAIRPPLAWGLKEAAAKATGEPLRHFPDGLRIEVGPGEVAVRLKQEPGVCFLACWVRLGGLLCVWVAEKNGWSRSPEPRAPPNLR